MRYLKQALTLRRTWDEREPGDLEAGRPATAGRSVDGRSVDGRRAANRDHARRDHPPPAGDGPIRPAERRVLDADLRITRFLTELSRALRPLADPEEITDVASAMLRERLAATGCVYAEVRRDDDRLVISPVRQAPDASPVPALTLSDLGDEALAGLRRNEPFILADAQADIRLGRADREACLARGVHSAIAAPLWRDGRFAAVVAVHDERPRGWTPEEVELVCAMAARCWESIERARAIRELKQSEQRLRFAQKAGRVGVFEWEIGADRVVWSPELEGLYGLPAGSFSGGFEEWCERLVPEDAERIRHGVKEAVAARRSVFTIEFRAVLADGEPAWLALQAGISYDEEGHPRRMIGVNIDIEDRKRAEHERELLLSQTLAARAEAEEANRAKSVFLTNMSHELRTPINAISGYAELMALGITGPVTEKQRSHLRRIKVSSDHLLTLVNEVIDLAKVESGDLPVARERIVLADVVLETLTMLGADAESHGVSVHDAVGRAGELEFHGDQDRVRQILVNLVSNAVKFTDPGGSVTISAAEADPAGSEAEVERRGRWLRVNVEDTGIGVPAEELESIFSPFYQVDGGYGRREDGTGLGLSISRRLARRMGGDLTAVSAEGRGSCFSLWLPIAVEEADERREWRPTAHDDPRLAVVGHGLIRSAAEIVERHGRLLRGEEGVENARGLEPARLADHIATFLTAIGVALVTLDEARGDPAQMRDGAEIQRTIARLHGAQRGRLGWTSDDVHAEFELLRAITRSILEETLREEASAALDEAIGVVGRLLEQAERYSVQGRARALQDRP
jgi:PAS domain S-box-containing protein